MWKKKDLKKKVEGVNTFCFSTIPIKVQILEVVLALNLED